MAEVEYRTMATMVNEIVWLRYLLQELGMMQGGATPLYCDHQAVLHISMNPVFHEQTKHVEIEYHFVRERIQSNEVIPRKVSTVDQLADIFTKALGKERFHYLLSKLGGVNLHVPT